MKKFFLSSLLSLFAFVGFTSAVNVSCSGEDGSEYELTCSPDTIFNSQSNSVYATFNISCSAEYIIWDTNTDETYSEGEITSGVPYEIPSFSSLDIIAVDSEGCDFSYTLTSDNSGNTGSDSGNNSGNTGSDSGNSSGTLISGGISQLSPVIVGLKTVFNEIIPYVVYIGIGVLIAVLGFYAIRWLMGYMTKKVTSVFSSKRRK